MRKYVGFILGPLLFIIILLMPEIYGMPLKAQKTAAVVVLMAVWWITEAIPIPATALIPIVLFPALGIMEASKASAPYAHHLIFLFLGGFFIAISMEKWNLHRRIALYTIRLTGTGTSKIILGFMISTAFLSMWISNTATTMMMVPIALAVINQSKEYLKKENNRHINTKPGEYRFALALMLSIAYAASIGGVATIIGSPPNTILVGFVEEMFAKQITFAQWMAIGLPLASIMLGITWVYITKIALKADIENFPGSSALFKNELDKLGPLSKEEKYILAVFLLVAVSWIMRGFLHFGQPYVQDSTIAMAGALLLFMIPVELKAKKFILDWNSALKAPWGVIILFGGGLSIAKAFMESGFSQWIGSQFTLLQSIPTMAFIFIVVLVTIFLTEITSNTATSALLIPLMGSLAGAMSIHPYGPMLGAGIAASYAFMLPVATPPNAVVFGSEYVTIPVMARVGLALNLIGSVLITLLILYLVPWFWGVDLWRY